VRRAIDPFRPHNFAAGHIRDVYGGCDVTWSRSRFCYKRRQINRACRLWPGLPRRDRKRRPEMLRDDDDVDLNRWRRHEMLEELMVSWVIAASLSHTWSTHGQTSERMWRQFEAGSPSACLRRTERDTHGDEVYPRQCPCRRAFELENVWGTWRTRRRSDENREARGFTQVQPPRKVKGLRPACLTFYWCGDGGEGVTMEA
jgi:hypothetical protein